MSKYAAGMLCIGDYDRESYACTTACHCSEECRTITPAALQELNAGAIPVEQLPEFLSHQNSRVRKRAKSELKRAESERKKSIRSNHFTKSPPKAEGETKYVRGAPVKIARGQVGSHGKSVKEELVDMPDANWAEPEELEVFTGNKGVGITSGFGEWVAPIAEQIERIDEADSVGELSEGLADEHDIVRGKADEKLRKLQKDQKEKSRFDTIDLDLEDN